MTNKLHLAIGILLITMLILSSCKEEKISPTLALFAEGFDQPCAITHAGDSWLFVVGQKGLIYLVDSTGKVRQEPFLDIRERITYGGERGLLGLAFHPEFRKNGYFFINYVGAGDTTFISRFTLLPGDTLLGDPGSELKLLRLIQPYSNHNGGTIAFGPDSCLYIGMGDGGSGGDPQNRAQNPGEFMGKMLRIDVNKGSLYTVPGDNPFVGKAGYLGEIWATGLRNPWKFSFDKQTGDLWIADVGQNKIEEINLQPASSKGGENYGWRCYEGNSSFNQDLCEKTTSFVFPVHTYKHGKECSITGGFIYRGNASSPFFGHYFYADYCSDRIWTIHKAEGIWKETFYGEYPGNNISTFGEDYKGELYFAGLSSGKIFRIDTSVKPQVEE